MEKNNKKQRIYLIVGIVLFLILVLSASYAYFQITSVNNATATTVRGTGETLGTPTLTTNTTSLSLNLTVDLMTKNNSYQRLYATPSGDAVIEPGTYPISAIATTPVTIENGRYTLATASVNTGNLKYNCNYAFDISATVSKAITDGSDQDIHVLITAPNGETTPYRLDELLAGTKTVSGTIYNLSKGENKNFIIESYVLNNNQYSQNDLAGNTYSITVMPKSGTSGFSCNSAVEPISTGFAKNLIDSNKLKQTGLEGDGYRFIGTGNEQYCVYDNGNYYEIKESDGTCSTLYNYTSTSMSTGVTADYSYQSRCPSNTTTATYSCTTKTPTVGNSPVDNYVCFGTTNKSDCTTNPDKYMYRIIGVFKDQNGSDHVKLIKQTPLNQQYAWHSTDTNNVLWHDSDLYKGINGSYFYTNTNYDYMQNSSWRGKIADWRWTEATDMMFLRGSVGFNNSVSYMDYGVNGGQKYNHQREVYLHELNRNMKKYKSSYWAYTNSKLGLMYASDYYLSVPLNDGYMIHHYLYLTPSWLNPVYNYVSDTYDSEWTMSRSIYHINRFLSPIEIENIDNEIYVGRNGANTMGYIRPTFYLNSDVELSSGTGTNTDPYILK